MLTEGITLNEIKKIFDKTSTKQEYISRLYDAMSIDEEIQKTINALNMAIINTWDYEISKQILRDMFFETDKYNNGIDCGIEIDELIENWHNHGLGNIDWPFSANGFDTYAANINRHTHLTQEEKDDLIAINAIRFRRIKEINTLRNDYIESLIIRHNENIIPTFKHSEGVDFYINGEPFDQKVSRSVGRRFIDYYGDDYYHIAINHPELVAESLYKHQDERRFDALPRLYIVYLNHGISNAELEESILNYDLNAPFEIDFEYIHSGNIHKTYHTHCYIILLHN